MTRKADFPDKLKLEHMRAYLDFYKIPYEPAMTRAELAYKADIYRIDWRKDEDWITKQTACHLIGILSPSVMWTHNPMGEYRSKPAGRKLKAFGVKKGWPDTSIFAPNRAPLHVEIKTLWGSLGDSQPEVRDGLVALGHDYELLRWPDQIFSILERHNIPLRGRIAA